MINIQNATVVKDRFGPDLVILETSLPSSMPSSTLKPARFKLDVEAGGGETYVRRHFPNIKTIPA